MDKTPKEKSLNVNEITNQLKNTKAKFDFSEKMKEKN